MDSLFHLGDYADDAVPLSALLNTGFVSVRGNCDSWSSAPLQQVIDWSGHRILLLHGHTIKSKQSLYSLARSNCCDILCYGHSHIASVEKYDDLLIINPGSISLPRGGSSCSLCVLTIDHKSVSAKVEYLC